MQLPSAGEKTINAFQRFSRFSAKRSINASTSFFRIFDFRIKALINFYTKIIENCKIQKIHQLVTAQREQL
jgi:hypothetical protein